MGANVLKRAGETRQGRLRRFDEVIARFVEEFIIAIFFEVFMVPRPLAPARATRSRTCADVITDFHPRGERLGSSVLR